MTTVTENQTKFAQPGDRFQLTGDHVPAELVRIRQVTGDMTKDTFSRSELALVGVDPKGLCLKRVLKPLQDSSPEQVGISLEELFERTLPTTKDAPKRFAAMFRLLANPVSYDDWRLCLANEGLLEREAFAYLRSEIVPACLAVITEAAFRDGMNSKEHSVQRLARRFLMETDPQRFAGRGANDGVALLVGHLSEIGNNDLPRLEEGTAVKLMAIVAVNTPLASDLRLPMLHSLRLYQMRQFYAPSTCRAAVEAEFQIFHA